MNTCRVTEGCMNPVENEETGACASCGQLLRRIERQSLRAAEKARLTLKMMHNKKQKPIPKITSKLASMLRQYVKEKNGWIKRRRCAVYPDRIATQVHHMKGRVGYADQWARDNDVPLLLDKRFWLAVSDEGHAKITTHSKWAFEKGFSVKRTST